MPHSDAGALYSSTACTDPITAPARLEWLDVAKGIGIVFVVLGHAMAGLIDGGTVMPVVVRRVFYLIYTSHMFLFFMLAGALVQGRVARDPARFRRGLLSKIAYPYFLWSIVQLVAIGLAGSLVNHPVDDLGASLLVLPFDPTGQFWFLFSLFLLHVVSALLLPQMDGVWLLVLAIGARALAQFPLGADIAERTLAFALPYAIGVVFALRINIAGKVPAGRGCATAALVAAAALLLTATYLVDLRPIPAVVLAHAGASPLERLAWRFDAAPAGGAVSFAVIALAHYSGPLARPLGYLGRLSFTIFVLHVLFVAGGRIAFAKLLGTSDYAIVLPGITVLGVAGPVVGHEILHRLNLTGWLGLT